MVQASDPKRGTIVIRNVTRGAVLSRSAELANSSWSRFRGLMLRKQFAEGSGIILDPCRSIHMLFMRFAIDVLYLDQADQIVRTQEHFRPWRIGPLWTASARYIIELPAGTVGRTGTVVGDQIRIELPS